MSHNKECNCKTPCKNCKCNTSTPVSKETPRRYLGQYPGDMEEFLMGIIDRPSRRATLQKAISEVEK